MATWALCKITGVWSCEIKTCPRKRRKVSLTRYKALHIQANHHKMVHRLAHCFQERNPGQEGLWKVFEPTG